MIALAGLRTEVQIVISLETLLRLRHDPAEIPGAGMLDADVARALATSPGAQWRRLVTDPITGALLDYGRSTYRPPAALATFIANRDPVCTFPHCTRPARACEQDHIHEWQHGGPTAAWNMHTLCKRHHRLKTLGLWKLTRHPNGTTTWTSPTRHHYHVPAHTPLSTHNPAAPAPPASNPTNHQPPPF